MYCYILDGLIKAQCNVMTSSLFVTTVCIYLYFICKKKKALMLFQHGL